MFNWESYFWVYLEFFYRIKCFLEFAGHGAYYVAWYVAGHGAEVAASQNFSIILFDQLLQI